MEGVRTHIYHWPDEPQLQAAESDSDDRAGLSVELGKGKEKEKEGAELVDGGGTSVIVLGNAEGDYMPVIREICNVLGIDPAHLQ